MTYLAKRHKQMPISEQERKTMLWPIQTMVNQMLDNLYSPIEPSYMSTNDLMQNMSMMPRMDMIDTKNSIKIEMEMPGMGPDDIKVCIDNSALTITGEKKMSIGDKDINYLAREVDYGCYQRCIALPTSIDTSGAKCTFKKGMLMIDMPKKMEAVKAQRELKVESM